MVENDYGIALTENDAEYTLIDVVEAVKNMGVNSINVQTIRNFLILNDEYFDLDDYVDFIDTINEIKDLYIRPFAYEQFNKTPDQLTEPERSITWSLESEGGLPISDRQDIHDKFIEISNDKGVLVIQDYDMNELAVFYYSIRG